MSRVIGWRLRPRYIWSHRVDVDESASQASGRVGAPALDYFVEMTLRSERDLALLRPPSHCIPSHGRLGEVIWAVDPDLLKNCLAA
jgi:hypothetical protein